MTTIESAFPISFSNHSARRDRWRSIVGLTCPGVPVGQRAETGSAPVDLPVASPSRIQLGSFTTAGIVA